jgi:hypothetical protein
MAGNQFDLFPDQHRTDAERPAVAFDPSGEFVDRVRKELVETLATVRDAQSFPWPDLTATTLAEMRFHSIVRWLPEDEAAALRAAFEREMARLYEVDEAEPRPE